MSIVHCKPMRSTTLFRALFWSALATVSVIALVPSQVAPSVFDSDKLNHFLAFFVLALIEKIAWPRSNTLVAMGLLALFGGLIEIFQFYAGFGRDGGWLDFAVDLVAICIGFASAQFFQLLRLRFYSPSKV